ANLRKVVYFQLPELSNFSSPPPEVEVYPIELKFDSVAKLFNYQQFNGRDFLRAVNIVKNSGYASISELSRKLGIIYKQSVAMINEMERQGIVKTLDQETPAQGIRAYNYGYKQNE
ncbi:DNA translocase FtsK, partial [Desulfobacter curvatus]|uniref:DNA translocase FtsK n=1 Tax=Desulfobacter curvatus TaxID=2290 RepID=UPI0005273A75